MLTGLSIEELILRVVDYPILDQVQQNDLYQTLMKTTDVPIDNQVAFWESMACAAIHKNSHLRSLAGQLMCRLVINNDREQLFFKYEQLIKNLCQDDIFITARHTIRSLWFIALGSDEHFKWYVSYIKSRYIASFSEKNGPMIRFDLFEGCMSAIEILEETTIRKHQLYDMASFMMLQETQVANQKKMKKLFSDFD